MTANEAASLSIGDFSRATHLSVKMLRHYHQLGLLVPAEVDAQTGYRRYLAAQIPPAQVIRRFRALEMPLEEIREVLAAPDLATRNERITGHLERLEAELGRKQQAVTALRGLLEPRARDVRLELRTTEATLAAAITAEVDAQEAVPWFQGALGELYATLDAQRIAPTACAGGVYADEIFTELRGTATLFVPCERPVRALGRVVSTTIPAAELAVIEHPGTPSEIDRSYGLLAEHVARHALAVTGPLREYYRVSRRDTPDEERWRTDVCWPVFIVR